LPGQLVLIDNSNIFIEGQKHNLSGCRFRLDFEKVISLVTDVGLEGDNRSTFVLFGSVPPDQAALWESMRRRGITVYLAERSSTTGKEKHVDVNLGTYFTADAFASRWSRRQRSYTLLSGDADFYGPICDALGVGFRVTVWCWESSCGYKLRGIAHENYELKFLNPHVSTISLGSWTRQPVAKTDRGDVSAPADDEWTVVSNKKKSAKSKRLTKA